MNYFTHLKTRYAEELEGSVIPFWTVHGIDREYGGFFSFLERDGTLYDTRKPLWMQWRAVYMFAALYNYSAFRKEEYLDIAVKGFDFLVKNGRTASGSYGFMLDRQGRMLSEKEGGAEARIILGNVKVRICIRGRSAYGLGSPKCLSSHSCLARCSIT